MFELENITPALSMTVSLYLKWFSKTKFKKKQQEIKSLEKMIKRMLSYLVEKQISQLKNRLIGLSRFALPEHNVKA